MPQMYEEASLLFFNQSRFNQRFLNMMHSEQIKKIITQTLSCEHMDIAGDGEIFEAVLVSSQFAGKNRVQRQQLVNAILSPYFESGKLHAFSMKTLTPDEWNALNG